MKSHCRDGGRGEENRRRKQFLQCTVIETDIMQFVRKTMNKKLKKHRTQTILSKNKPCTRYNIRKIGQISK